MLMSDSLCSPVCLVLWLQQPYDNPVTQNTSLFHRWDQEQLKTRTTKYILGFSDVFVDIYINV